jgi:peptide/nickel transport system substrate-binding protein
MTTRIVVLAWLAWILVSSPVVEAQELKIGVAVETNSIDPMFLTTAPNAMLARHVFESLVRQDERQRLKPGLAVSWRAVDATAWEFRLRPGVRFHDGSDFTAEDVAFSLRRAPGVNASIVGAYAVYTRQIARIEIVDPLTIRLHTATPYPLMPYDMSVVPIVSRRIGEGATSADFNTGKAAIGTGPFRFAQWIPGERVVMTRNDDYWGPKPAWRRVIFAPIPNDTARVAALLAHDVDLIDGVPPSALADLRARPDVGLAQTAFNRLEFLHMDSFRDHPDFVTDLAGNPLDRNPFKDVRVRKAIAKAIDRNALVNGINQGMGVPAGQFLPDGIFGTSPDLKPEPYDPDGARRLLAEAGYPSGFGVTLHGPSGRFVNDAKITAAVGQMLARVGISAQVETMPVAMFKTRVAKYDMSIYIDGWWADTGEASNSLRALVATVNPATGWGLANRGRYSNPRLDALLERALATIDDEARDRLLQQASEMAIADVGLVPLYFEIAVWASRKGFAYSARADGFTLATGVTPTSP